MVTQKGKYDCLTLALFRRRWHYTLHKKCSPISSTFRYLKTQSCRQCSSLPLSRSIFTSKSLLSCCFNSFVSHFFGKMFQISTVCAHLSEIHFTPVQFHTFSLLASCYFLFLIKALISFQSRVLQNAFFRPSSRCRTLGDNEQIFTLSHHHTSFLFT